MDEAPVIALRQKPGSSIAVMAQMQADGQLDAGISAGNTGACVAASQMRLRRLRGAHRPGIAVVAPTFHGPVVICDVGANVNCRPVHLHQYGIMASIYSQAICGVKQPRVGLLSVGQEDAKGNELVKQTRALLKADKRLRFVGNVEGRDVFGGVVDVMVCEGFVGNVMLKLMEGMAGGVMKSMLKELVAEMPPLAEKVTKAAEAVAMRYDYNEYGGAPLLGVGGISIICHGASDYRAIKNAVRVAEEFARLKVNEQITELLSDGAEDR
jgi:glycerol-3-phosphate acyltransferase PlsX